MQILRQIDSSENNVCDEITVTAISPVDGHSMRLLTLNKSITLLGRSIPYDSHQQSKLKNNF